ncbi:C-type lectin domain family 4 member F-like protein [Aphelenchoides avenae]|nr:C-type lectin domain family 4 member F-like protein [Aphelenchus avenae]
MRGQCPSFFWQKANVSEPVRAKYGMLVDCPDPTKACLLRDDGTTCSGGDFPPDSLEFYPYCDASGKCNMYLVQQGQYRYGVKCADGTEKIIIDQFGGSYDNPALPFDQYDYLKVTAVCCDGCDAILPGSNQCTSAATTSTSTTASTTLTDHCDDAESLVQVDATNNTVLTAGLNAAWNAWSRSDKANFAAYKRRIENVVYNRSMSGAEKLSQVSAILDGYAPDGSAAKDLILAIPLTGYGSLCDMLNCAIRGGHLAGPEKDCAKFTTTTSTTTSTTTTSVSSTPTTASTVITTTTSPAEDAYYCPAGWTYFAYTKSCYMLNRDVPASSFEEQEKACEALGSHLMSIHRNSEQTLILAILVEKFVVSAWIGLHSPTSNATYVWTDGTPYDYRHWEEGFPNASAPHHCTRVLTTDQVKLAPWRNADCAQNLPGICKKAATPVGQGKGN